MFSEEYRLLTGVIVEARRAAGISQRALAARLGRANSHVSMIERGQRRIDALELFRIAEALGSEPAALYGAFCERLQRWKVEQALDKAS